MGCASSVNVKIIEDGENKKIIANDKKINCDNKLKSNEDKIFTNIKKESNDNDDNFYNNQSTNFKYSKKTKTINLIKSKQIKNDIQEKGKNGNKYIEIKHPLDKSSETNNDINNKNNQEERYNTLNDMKISKDIGNEVDNYITKNNLEDEDYVNYENYRDADDICNIGQSKDFDLIKKNNKNDLDEDISVIFTVQSTGVKYQININKNCKLIELIDEFKKKVKLSSFERPEFVFNNIYLIDNDKLISDYNIIDKSKINVFL